MRIYSFIDVDILKNTSTFFDWLYITSHKIEGKSVDRDFDISRVISNYILYKCFGNASLSLFHRCYTLVPIMILFYNVNFVKLRNLDFQDDYLSIV